MFESDGSLACWPRCVVVCVRCVMAWSCHCHVTVSCHCHVTVCVRCVMAWSWAIVHAANVQHGGPDHLGVRSNQPVPRPLGRPKVSAPCVCVRVRACGVCVCGVLCVLCAFVCLCVCASRPLLSQCAVLLTVAAVSISHGRSSCGRGPGAARCSTPYCRESHAHLPSRCHCRPSHSR